MDIEWVLLEISKKTEIGDLANFAQSVAAQFGVVRWSYHLSPPLSAHSSPDTQIVSRGYPEEWVAVYNNKDFRRHLPVPDHIMKAGRPMRWYEAGDEAHRTPEEREFSAQFRALGMPEGVGLPVYGPGNRDAFVSFGLAHPVGPRDESKIQQLWAIAQAFHSRVCNVLGQAEDAVVELSPREMEVMQWVALGKSSRDIGVILGISAETVKTYTRRIYDKLDAHDRLGATIKALQLNLIRI